MKPPICYLCHEDFRHEEDMNLHTRGVGQPVGKAARCGLVEFIRTPEEQERRDAFFREGRQGGPPTGEAWFCPGHYQRALELARIGLTLDDAIRELKAERDLSYRGLPRDERAS